MKPADTPIVADISAHQSQTMPDVQGQTDLRNIPIQAAGVRGVKYPIRLRVSNDLPDMATVAEFELTVALPAHQKGTHMSRFVEILEGLHSKALALNDFSTLLPQMLARLEADEGCIRMRMPVFLPKAAPVSGVVSLMDYDVTWEVSGGKAAITHLILVIPVTSLCPCSKKISDYGAHNQRSHVTVRVQCVGPVDIPATIKAIEQQASCELYGLLKRVDEKYVTERAYDNPKFVEDLVRDVALVLDAQTGVGAYRVFAENFESIHNHSAFACVEKNNP